MILIFNFFICKQSIFPKESLKLKKKLLFNKKMLVPPFNNSQEQSFFIFCDVTSFEIHSITTFRRRYVDAFLSFERLDEVRPIYLAVRHNHDLWDSNSPIFVTSILEYLLIFFISVCTKDKFKFLRPESTFKASDSQQLVVGNPKKKKKIET